MRSVPSSPENISFIWAIGHLACRREILSLYIAFWATGKQIHESYGGLLCPPRNNTTQSSSAAEKAGKFIAWHLGSQGKNVANIEKDAIGGACPNIACLPSKNVIHCAKVASFFQRGAEFGIVHGKWHVDMAAVRARQRRMVDGLHDMHLANYTKTDAEIVMGFGSFIAAQDRRSRPQRRWHPHPRSDYIFLDTGSRATIDPIPGLAESPPLTHIEVLELTTLPEHLLILGGGFVGLELAQAMRRFGPTSPSSSATPRLAHREDPDVIETIQQLFHDEDIDIVTNANITRVEGTSGTAVSFISPTAGPSSKAPTSS